MYKYFSAFLYFSHGVKDDIFSCSSDFFDNTTDNITIKAVITIPNDIKII